jgi:hypothetical protein
MIQPHLPPGLGFGLALGLTFASASFCASASAQSASIRIDEGRPEDSVPSQAEAMKDPLAMSELVMDLAARAERAEGEGSHASAARYYRALAKAVPNRATAFSKACQSYELAGAREDALAMCRAALGLPGVTSADGERFLRLLVAGPKLSSTDIDDADALLAHLETEAKGEAALLASVVEQRCALAAKLEDTARLDTCYRAISSAGPNDPRRFLYGSLLAVAKKDWDGLDALLAEGKRAGVDTAVIESALAPRRRASEGAMGSPGCS